MKVPVWVILQNYEDKEKMGEILSWFKEAEVYARPWPSTSFKDTLLAFRNKGWQHEIPKDESEYVVNPQLLALAAAEHVKKTLGATSQISFKVPPHHTSRRVKSDADYPRMFDDLLLNQPQIVLSQMFQVGERCHQEGKQNYRVWLTMEPCNRSLLTSISDRVITVGEGDDANINTKNVDTASVREYLEREFSFILSHN